MSYNGLSLLIATAALFSAVAPVHAQDSPSPGSGAAGNKPASAEAMAGKPNILVIMGDDVGFWNVSAYNQGKSERGEISMFTR